MTQMTMSRSLTSSTLRGNDFPLNKAEHTDVLAIIVGVDGPSYRPVGAAMIVNEERVTGSLSSGCIDADIVLHAKQTIADRRTRRLRYGTGSPYFDIKLPCGGGLDILVVPAPACSVLDRVRQCFRQREPLEIWIGESGLTLGEVSNSELRLQIEADLRFLVFGKGPEAATFSRMTASAGYDTVLISPDEETTAALHNFRVTTIPLVTHAALDMLMIDGWTAGVLFFHDHDYETAILRRLLTSKAFYIGAQGSRRTAERRLEKLKLLGFGQEALGRVLGPIGIIPSTRDPRTLAVSVFAEILQHAVMKQ